jgi:3-deoxy-manno-octulosonate cytidylyltransferase (CMP-KDO synthetase)
VAKVVVIIPARYSSVRFPGKPLVSIKRKALILHVIERILNSKVSEIIVATDSQSIKALVEKEQLCRVIMTRSDHACGTDRIAEVADHINADYILNVQGDQLITGPDMINEIIAHINSNLKISTIYTRIKDLSELDNKNIIKAVVNRNGDIIYMSRSPIPFDKDQIDNKINYNKQVGIYLFNKMALANFSKLESGELEKIEGIELLRAIEHGLTLTGIYSDFETVDVNIPEDIAKAEKFIRDFPVK